MPEGAYRETCRGFFPSTCCSPAGLAVLVDRLDRRLLRGVRSEAPVGRCTCIFSSRRTSDSYGPRWYVAARAVRHVIFSQCTWWDGRGCALGGLARGAFMSNMPAHVPVPRFFARPVAIDSGRYCNGTGTRYPGTECWTLITLGVRRSHPNQVVSR